MCEEQKAPTSEDEIRSYNILLQRHLNDDRLMAERISIFLLASSFLFLGFATLLNVEGTAWLRIAVPSVGLLLCFFAFVAAWRTSKGLDFWEAGERKLEEGGESFTYMRKQEIAPHLVYEHMKRSKLGWLPARLRNRYIYPYCIPVLFGILWVIALLVVYVN